MENKKKWKASESYINVEHRRIIRKLFVLFQPYVRFPWRLVPVVITPSNGITISVRGSAHDSGTADVIATETGLIRKTIAKQPASVRKTMVYCSHFSLLSQLPPIFSFLFYFQHILLFPLLREPRIDSSDICLIAGKKKELNRLPLYSGGFRLVKLEGLSPSILWCPKGGGVRGGGVEFQTGGAWLWTGEAKPPLAPS